MIKYHHDTRRSTGIARIIHKHLHISSNRIHDGDATNTAEMLSVLKNAFPMLAGVGIAAIGAKLEELKKDKELKGVAGPSQRVEPRTGGSFEA